MIKYLAGAGSIFAIAAALAVASPAQAATQADCAKLWSEVDKDGKNIVSVKDAQAAWSDRADAVKAADANKDDSLSAAEFMAACTNGDLDKR